MFLHLLSSLLILTANPQSITLDVSTTGAAKGDFHIAVYATAEDYAARKTVAAAIRPATGKNASVEVQLPNAGTYVVAGYHDVNGNGELDMNVFGIPKEPYGFIRPPESKWVEPEFKDIATDIPPTGKQATLVMKLWKEF